MRIVIVGAGQTGIQLAKYLIQEKHDVSIIEANEDRARHASNRLDCMVINEKGNNFSALKDAGIGKADALVCVTESDEMNMIICSLAASLLGETGTSAEPDNSKPRYEAVVRRNRKLLKIARVRNDDYINLHLNYGGQVLGIDHFIHPGMEVARSIIRIIEHGVIGEIFSFANTPYELSAIDIFANSAMDGLALTEYRKLVAHESLITLLERGGDVMLPSGSTVLKSGDRVHILVDSKNISEISRLAGDLQKPVRKIGIVGGGKLGSLIAEGLLNDDSMINKALGRFTKKRNLLTPLLNVLIPRKRRVVIIDQDSRLCNELAARFPSALILNEDISDESFVNEEVLDDLDCIVTTTTNEELNIITAVFMKSRGIKSTIALVTGSGHAAIARHLGVDAVIPMQSVVVDTILSHLMGSGVKGVRSLGGGTVDLIEIEISKNAPVINKPISVFRLSTGGLILLVNRGEESFIPKGDYVFQERDHIVLIAKVGSQAEIEKYFSAGV